MQYSTYATHNKFEQFELYMTTVPVPTSTTQTSPSICLIRKLLQIAK